MIISHHFQLIDKAPKRLLVKLWRRFFLNTCYSNPTLSSKKKSLIKCSLCFPSLSDLIFLIPFPLRCPRVLSRNQFPIQYISFLKYFNTLYERKYCKFPFPLFLSIFAKAKKNRKYAVLLLKRNPKGVLFAS